MTAIISILLMKQLRLKQTVYQSWRTKDNMLRGGGERKGKGEKEEGEAGHLKGNGDTVLYIWKLLRE